jgi:hypothetical protein
MRALVSLLYLVAVAVAIAHAAVARAAEDRPLAVDEQRAVEERHAVEQPFLYMTDTHGPAPRQVVAGYALAFSSSAGAIRPIPGHFDQEGVVHTLGLEAGVVPRVQLFGTALIAEAIGHSEVGAVAVQGGARVLLTSPRSERFRLVADVAFLREFSADMGIAGQLTASSDLGRLRLAASIHAEHLFATGRDPIDLYGVAGASLRVHRLVRVGAEYVVQDLEAAFDPEEAELGVRHYLGPDVALTLARNHILVTVGAAVQVASAPGLLARGAVNYVF